MASITLNDSQIEVEDGRPLLEVIKEQGIAITNLCYIDGLEPYAGCRTCLVEIEGGRPTSMQLSCTAVVSDGMVVRTETAKVKEARQSVMSLILANHPDRCLTCHRRVHCMPGEICLRDDVVTHRCLTCSKNYRCELQTACEIIDMGEWEEPWVGEARSYYETPPPEPDRGNPYLEFDPQMCIICTRCVRACADIRHTGAISLAGKGFETQIAFGTGGPVHESDCDFCGACIDVCPTATLMEKPNKWVGLAEDWTNSACNGCSVGCTISYGVSGDRPVIVRPDRVNPFSRDQICVRGRFGYAAVPDRDRLTRSLARRGERLLPVAADEALREAAESLARIRGEHGAEAIAVLGSPHATNEEARALVRLAREALGTPHVDFAHGAVHRAVAEALAAAFGDERLPSSLTDVEHAATIVAVAGDLEESHQVAALRVKDAVVKRQAALVVVSPRWGELVPFAQAWVRPLPGREADAVDALADAASGGPGAEDALTRLAAAAPSSEGGHLERAVEIARDTAGDTAGDEGEEGSPRGGFSVLFAPTAVSVLGAPRQAGRGAAACANLAIAARGEGAPASLHYLPTEANVLGIADMGMAPADGGHDLRGMVEAMERGEIRALLVHAEDPLLAVAGAARLRAALGRLEALVVVDSLLTGTAELASAVLASLPFHATDGTLTTADRRLVRQRPAATARGEERPAGALLASLAEALGTPIGAGLAAETMEEIAASVPGYVPLERTRSGRTRALPDPLPEPAAPRRLPLADDGGGEPEEGVRLLTGRSLYTSREAASIGSPEADPLHREEAAHLNPRDAEAAGIGDGDPVALSFDGRELTIPARLDDGVAPGTAYVPQYVAGGALTELLPLEGEPAGALRLAALAPA